MQKDFFIIRDYKVYARADSYIDLLEGYLNLDTFSVFIDIDVWISDLDECECSDGEICFACQDYGESNIVFHCDNDGEDIRFLKIPEEYMKSQDLMAKWVFENSDILIKGDCLIEGEEISINEAEESLDKTDLMVISKFDKLISIEENELPDLDDRTIFKIKKIQDGRRKGSNFMEIKNELIICHPFLV